MTTKIVFKEQIRSQVLKVLSGYCFNERRPEIPSIDIISPWISNVQLEISEDVYKLDELFFGQDYGIASINLPYALLLLKLDFDATITIVTLPPTKRYYNDRWQVAENLLDFLDEIGCIIYVNPNLHSKLILSNDVALIGSFNLSIPALYGREEIGIHIDDMENLKILEGYVSEVIQSSKRYGVCIQERKRIYRGMEFGKGLVTTKVTRGWLLRDIAHQCYGGIHLPPDIHEFLFYHFGTIYTFEIAKKVASNLEAFYTKAILAYFQSKDYSDEERLEYLRRRFGYDGKHELGEISDFLKTKFARDHIPKITPKIIPVPSLNNF